MERYTRPVKEILVILVMIATLGGIVFAIEALREYQLLAIDLRKAVNQAMGD